MKKYIGPVLSLASIAMLFYIIYNQKHQIKELKTSIDGSVQKTRTIDSLHTVIDSLSSEVFIEHTNYERYEIALDRLRDVSPKSAEEFDLFLSTTE
jgi:predicted RNase H-like nuclease (RuvC/YqgF family)